MRALCIAGLLLPCLSGAQASTLLVPSHQVQGCLAIPVGSGNPNAAAVLADLKTARADLDPSYAGGCRAEALHLVNGAFEAVLALQEQELQQPAFPAGDPREKNRRAGLLKALSYIHAATLVLDASLKDDRDGRQAVSSKPLDDAIRAVAGAFPTP